MTFWDDNTEVKYFLIFSVYLDDSFCGLGCRTLVNLNKKCDEKKFLPSQSHSVTYPLFPDISCQIFVPIRVTPIFYFFENLDLGTTIKPESISSHI